jgi:hypothetical protein
MPDLNRRRFTSGNSLDHRNVDIGVGVSDRPTISREETLDGKEGTALVAVREWVISGKVLNQSRSLFKQRRIGLLATETGPGRRERRLGKRDPRQARDLFRGGSEDFSGDQAVVTELEEVDLGHR